VAAEQTIRPGRHWYVVALVIFLIGSLLAGVLAYRFVTGLMGLTDDLTQVVVPGSADLALTETGDYTIFYEHRSVVDGRVYQTGGAVPGLDVSLVSMEDGSPVELRSPGSNTTYSVGDRSGVSVLAFSIDRPGIYELSAAYPTGRSGPEVVLAVGEGVGRGILTSIGALFAAGGLFCATGLLAVGIVAITLVKRRRVLDGQEQS
jgi:hypothetical protein